MARQPTQIKKGSIEHRKLDDTVQGLRQQIADAALHDDMQEMSRLVWECRGATQELAEVLAQE